MDPVDFRQMADDLEKVNDFIRGAYPEIDVELEYEKEFDLGEFGYRSLECSMSDENYGFDLGEVWSSNAPVSANDIEGMVDQLNQHANALEEAEEARAKAALSVVCDALDLLAESEDEDEQALANTLVLTLALYQRLKAKPTVAVGTPVPAFGTSLPPAPLPWPGALREDIDYTADDFPQRYQPPPGFDWCDLSEVQVNYEHAYRKVAWEVHGAMHLDDKGRVTWHEIAPDADYGDGYRWLVMHHEREGIPSGQGFDGLTPPRALDEDGRVINQAYLAGKDENHPDYNWWNISSTPAYTAVRELREKSSMPTPATPAGGSEFAPPAPVSL